MARISRSTALSESHAQITKGARQLHSSGSATCGSPLPDHCPLKRSTSLACGWRRSRTALARRGVHRPRIPNDTLRGSTVSPFWGAGASQLIMYSRPLVPAPYAELGNYIPPSLLARADAFLSCSGPFMAEGKSLRHCSTSVCHLRDFWRGHGNYAAGFE